MRRPQQRALELAISDPEAAWRVCQFPTHHVELQEVRLQVHPTDQVQVYFDPKCDVAPAMDRAARSTLTARFRSDTLYPDIRNLLYSDYPSRCTWHTKLKEWAY